MNSSSVRNPETQNDAAHSIAERLLGQPVAQLEAIGGGRNSRVYRITTVGGERFALKGYFHRGAHQNDRLETEFSSLQFVRQHGGGNVPKPLAADRATGYALYEYIDGRKVPVESLTPDDIDAAVGFLARLNEFATAADSSRLRSAAEACFSVDALLANLDFRLNRLTDRRDDGNTLPEFETFLIGELLPSFQRMTISDRVRAAAGRELAVGERTLSPSDFGFHNALRRESGGWVFLDFEYFGWDDPAKMLCDFLLHPAMEIKEVLRDRFARGLYAVFAGQQGFRERVQVVAPLYGLKWALILLNEFLPEHLERRKFATARPVDWQPTDWQAVQREQLAKARRMLQRASDFQESFPYGN